MLEGTEDEQYERLWEPVFPQAPVIEGNLARAIVKKSLFVLLVLPKNDETGEPDPNWAELLKYNDSGQTVLFFCNEDAFRYGLKYVDDPWQVVEL
jgi:hypothetical protein